MFKALTCDTTPHFTSIASFISSHPDAIEDIFTQILMVCDEHGLIGHELIATDDGRPPRCKISYNAAKEHSGTFDELARKRDKIQLQIIACMKEHKSLDRRRKGESDRKDQLEKTLSTLDKHVNTIDQFLKTVALGRFLLLQNLHFPHPCGSMGPTRRPKEVKSNITDNESAKMLTSKGTIQGYNGVAAVNNKHQIIVDAQTFGEGQENHTLKPIIEGIQARFDKAELNVNIVDDHIVITADTGFAHEANYAYLKEEAINAYVPDNAFRSHDPKFKNQKSDHGKRHQDTVKGVKKVIRASEFKLNRRNKTCICPEGNQMWLHTESRDDYGEMNLAFEGKLTDCRNCARKHECMRNPSSADTREGHGRQVSFTVNTSKSPIAWMQKRVDSRYGKQVYGHRMSLRGKQKMPGQWQPYCLVHNIEEIANYGAIS